MSPWAPLRQRDFRALWIATFVALVGSWMSDSSAAWLMTTLATSPLLVALVQSAMTLPILLLGLPAGAIADIFDRRRVLIATQVWVTCVALALFAATLSGRLTAELLLALTFANGVGAAMRMPVVGAMTPELVPRNDISQAFALHGVAINGSRVLGPVLAGILLAWFGGPWVFLVYAVLSAAVGVALARGEHRRRASSLPSERFVGAMRLGVQFARQTPVMVAVLAHAALFCFFAIAMHALLPLVAREQLAGDASVFTLLLASLGFGAVCAVPVLPEIRHRLPGDRLLAACTLLQAAATFALSQATSIWVAAPAAFAGGAAWISAFNTLNVAAQSALPDWVRARGMAVFLVATMAGATAGSFAWGQTAAVVSLPMSLLIAAGASLVAYALLRQRYSLSGLREFDLTPQQLLPEFASAHKVDNDKGPVLVSFEYRIDPARAEEFAAVMADSRRWRLRMGAIHWGLYRDVTDPGRYVEHFLVESWLDRLRQIERITAEDIALRDRKNEFHLGPEPPVMKHLLMEQIER